MVFFFRSDLDETCSECRRLAPLFMTTYFTLNGYIQHVLSSVRVINTTLYLFLITKYPTMCGWTFTHGIEKTQTVIKWFLIFGHFKMRS